MVQNLEICIVIDSYIVDIRVKNDSFALVIDIRVEDDSLYLDFPVVGDDSIAITSNWGIVLDLGFLILKKDLRGLLLREIQGKHIVILAEGLLEEGVVGGQPNDSSVAGIHGISLVVRESSLAVLDKASLVHLDLDVVGGLEVKVEVSGVFRVEIEESAVKFSSKFTFIAFDIVITDQTVSI
eukprot:CAMPEP_0114589144 /NCGR_PEP_ID=MMETSP0125-20121206/11671_1 /TAXON_ID=485358 ORGANISM="Aristerostoma sp., Strain ATCC 50986" /NCGR_SAMPLE_ID=MMETSP0125 /ASSEMBLY_ACC=CAM_ASM_000245 /LENGTH=181 /DNA_ID=CAMNT_0001785895 /DNA_START=590 /DNA_END=1135 /DNA_ORIENTATION=+